MSESASPHKNRQVLVLCLLVSLAVVGGAIAIWTASAAHQRRIVAALTEGKTHNRVGYDVQGMNPPWFGRRPDPPGPVWLRNWLGIDFFSSIAWAHVSEPTEGVIEQLASLPALRHLEFSGEHKEFDLAPLDNLHDLETLSLENLTLLGDGLAVLTRLPKLRSLRLSNGENFDDAQFEFVGRLTNLRKLEVYYLPPLTDAGIAKLAGLENLEELTLFTQHQTTDAVLERLTALDHLRELILDYGQGLQSTGGLRFLPGFTHLEKLELYRVNDAGLAAVVSAPAVKDLTLAGSRDPGQWLGEPGLRNVEAFPNVERLTLLELPALNDEALAHVTKLPNLRELTITFALTTCPLTDAGIAHLADLKKLEKLQLRITIPSAVSPEAIELLRQQLPACEIQFETK
jgi:hypothetical protein